MNNISNVAAALIAAWIRLFGERNNVTRQMRAHPEIVHAVDMVAGTMHVPVELLLTVGIMESRLGSDVPNGGDWGMRPSIVSWACRRRGIGCGVPPRTQQIEVGALVLRDGRRACGSWEGAVRYYRTGKCGVEHDTTGYGHRAIALTRRLQRATGVRLSR